MQLRCMTQMIGTEVWWVGICAKCGADVIGETPESLRVRADAPPIDWSFDYGDAGDGETWLGAGDPDGQGEP